MEAAVVLLREKGMAQRREARRPRDDRRARSATASPTTARSGTMVAVGCETEPVSKNDEFQAFAQEGARPRRGRRASTPRRELEDERVELSGEARREHRRRRRAPASKPSTAAVSARTRTRRRTSSACSCSCAAATTSSAASSRCTSSCVEPAAGSAARTFRRTLVAAEKRDLRELRRGAVEAGAGA